MIKDITNPIQDLEHQVMLLSKELADTRTMLRIHKHYHKRYRDLCCKHHIPLNEVSHEQG